MEIRREDKTIDHYLILCSAFKINSTLDEFLKGNSETYTLRNNGTLEGLINCSFLGDRININYVLVFNKIQGLGTSLLKYILTKGKHFTCSIRESNIPSIRFFVKHGFEEYAVEQYSDGENKIKMRYGTP